MPFPPSRALATAAILIAAAVVPSGRAAGADDPAALAKTALAAIAADEAAIPSGRFTIGVAERRARWENGEAVSVMRKRLAGERAVHADGSFVFTAEGWKKDLSIPKSDLNPAPTRTRTAELSGMLRFLVETTTPDGPRSRGLVTRSPFSAPGDAVLAHQVAHSLEGVHWSKARSEGELLILEGERDTERHVITLRQANGYHLKSWDLIRTVVDPTGRATQQLYFCDITPGPSASVPAQVEEWVENPPPASNDAYRVTEIKKLETTPPVKGEELRIPFPKGTIVTDNRTGEPVEYELAAEGLDEGTIAAAVEAISRGQARVGDAAPPFELADTHGKKVHLEGFRGKPLLLFWFSSRSKPSEAAAPALAEAFDNYRKRGVEVVAIDVREEGDAAKEAEAFGKRFHWSFPILIDPDADTVRHYGGLIALPKVAIVDPAGKLQYSQPGFDPDAVQTVLDKILTTK